jgi:transcriptional regulator with XRE-family HTH domain
MQNNVNLGLAIEQRINELGISKAEFGRRIGTSKQNVTSILRKQSMDTDSVCRYNDALGCNFFTLFCVDELNGQHNIAIADNGSKAQAGTHQTIVYGAAELSEQVKILESNVTYLKEKITFLEQRIADKDNSLRDKDALIQILKNK